MQPLASFPDELCGLTIRAMSELLDPRPVFTIVMGCDGAGKSAWKRDNYDLLPSRYFDQDSFAGGIGDWNSSEAHTRARVYIDAQIEESIDQRLDFGRESTDSDKPGSALVERVIKAGYRVEGIYFGTNDPQINIDRIEHRVFARTGHMVDPETDSRTLEALAFQPAPRGGAI